MEAGKHVVESCELTIELLDISATQFSGHAVLSVAVANPPAYPPLSAVVLNSRGLVYTRVDVNGESVPFVTDDARETLTFDLPPALAAEPRLTVSASWRGTVATELAGFFRIGQGPHFLPEERAAGTHFEPVYARRAFPCLDTPSARCRFALTVAAPAGATVLSNMRPAAAPVPRAGPAGEALEEHRFPPTPPMPPYLLCWYVGSFSRVPVPALPPFPPQPDGADVLDPPALAAAAAAAAVEVWTTPGKEAEAAVAAAAAVDAVAWFGAWVGAPCGVDRLAVVVPAEYPIGGMEHWGCIALSPRVLLAADATPASRARVETLVAHEVSHQWFGDLVGVREWRDLWAKEGVATALAELPVAARHPAWCCDTTFVAGAVSDALLADQWASGGAIAAPVTSAAGAQEAYNALAYDKSAAILRCVRAAVGADAYRRGFARIVEARAGSAASAADMCAAFTAVSSGAGAPADGGAILASWVVRPGFPLLRVSEEGGDGGADGPLLLPLRVTQERYIAGATTAAAAAADPAGVVAGVDGVARSGWALPVRVASPSCGGSAGTTAAFFDGVDAAAAAVIAPPPGAGGWGGWVCVNAGAAAPARVMYSTPRLLSAHLAGLSAPPPGGCGPADRIAAVGTAAAFFAGGVVGTAYCEGVLAAAAAGWGGDPHVAAAVGTAAWRYLRFWRLASHPAARPAQARAEAFVSQALGPVLEGMGWQCRHEEDDACGAARAELVAALCAARHQPTLERARAAARAFLAADAATPTAAALGVDAALLTACLSAAAGATAAEGGDAAEFSAAAARVSQARPAARHSLAMAQGAVPSRAAALAWADAAVGGAVPQGNVAAVFLGLAHNLSAECAGVAWEALTRLWPKVYAAWGSSQFTLKAIIANSVRSLPRPGAGSAEAVAAFFAANPADVAAGLVRQLGVELAVGTAAAGHHIAELERSGA